MIDEQIKVGQDQCKCRSSWDNGKGRCGQSRKQVGAKM